MTVVVSSVWVLGFIWLMFVVGMLTGTAIFTIALLLMVVRMKPAKAVIYAIGIIGFIWAMKNLAHIVSSVGYLQSMMRQ